MLTLSCMPHAPVALTHAGCSHVHDTTSRYDHAEKRLELLLTCAVCKTERVIHSLSYEPRFEPSGATVHSFPERGAVQAFDRAA